MQQLIVILHVLIAISIIGLILVQHGKGSGMGAGFGSGASGTMFGSQGATPFLVKLTGVLALLFFLTSGILSFLVNKHAQTQALPLPSTPATVQPIPVEQPVAPVKPVGAMPIAPASGGSERK